MRNATVLLLRPFLMAFLLVAPLAFAPVSAWALDLAGAVEQVKGNAFLNASGNKKAIKVASKVHQGDEITTEADAEVLLRLTDGTVLAVRPNSQMKLSQYTFSVDDKAGKDDNFLVDLVKGGMRTLSGKIGKRKPAQFKVNTPTATIGIRGTDFEVAVLDKPQGEAQAGTYNKVFDGRTFMQNAQGGQVEVGANQAAFTPLDAVNMAKQFGLLKSVPNVFFSGTFDGMLNGLQDEAFRRLESKLGLPLPNEVKNLLPKVGDFFKDQ